MASIPTMEIREASGRASVIDLRGQVTAAAESALMDAHTQATASGAHMILLNFSELEYMNSSGIGLLVTLLIRANRQGQKIAAFGLSPHYEDIFELTRLDEAIHIYDTEEAALAAASSLVFAVRTDASVATASEAAGGPAGWGNHGVQAGPHGGIAPNI